MKLNLKKYACLLIALVLALSTVFVGGGITASANDDGGLPSDNSRVAPGGPIFDNDLKDPGGADGPARAIVWRVPDEHKTELSKLPCYNGSDVYINAVDYVDSYVENLPSYLNNNSYNDIDNLLCVLRYMNDYFCDEQLEQEIPYSHYDSTYNQIMGFIRSLHVDYANDDYRSTPNGLYRDYWRYIAGEVSSLTIDKMQLSEHPDLLYQYFYRFAPENKFNNYIYNGTIPNDLADKDLYPQYGISDPLGSGKSIDLLHMFASMDGVYDNTGRWLITQGAVDQYTQKDLASWLGDLHTLTASFSANSIGLEMSQLPSFSGEIISNSPEEELKELSGVNCSSFPYGDLLADIDAFNIATIILNCRNLRLIDAIALYYNIMPNDSEQYNRYTMFVYCSTLQTHRIKTGNMITDFKNEVYSSLNLQITDNGVEDNNYLSDLETMYLEYEINNIEYMPTEEQRKYCAEFFFNYIINKANLN